MKHSIRYIQVRVEMVHDEGVDPEDVLSECDYKFESTSPGQEIRDTEIQAYSELPWE